MRYILTPGQSRPGQRPFEQPPGPSSNRSLILGRPLGTKVAEPNHGRRETGRLDHVKSATAAVKARILVIALEDKSQAGGQLLGGQRRVVHEYRLRRFSESVKPKLGLYVRFSQGASCLT